MAKPTFEIACLKKHETDNAVLIYDYATDEEHWFPLSHVESMHFDQGGDGTIVVTKWIALQKGYDV